VERERQNIAELERQEAELADELETLDAAIADAMLQGEDATELQARRREADELRRAITNGLPMVRERLRERQRSLLKREAGERLAELKKRAGDVAGEATRQMERAEKLAAQLSETLEWLAWAPLRVRCYWLEAEALTATFDLAAPDLKPLPGGRQNAPPPSPLRPPRASVVPRPARGTAWVAA